MMFEVESMLKVENIKKQYEGHGRNVLDGISFEAKRGEFVAIIGKSGSGKTTLLNLIAGLEIPSSGVIKIDAEDMSGYGPEEYCDFRNFNIGIVFQEFHLIDELNVFDNVMLPLSLSNAKASDNKKKTAQALKRLGIDHIHKRLAKNLSGGEKAKTSIARAMVHDPDYVLCDEPTGSLDNENASLVFQTLKQISKEKLVIVVTHDDALIEEYATRLIRLHDGKIVSDETRGGFVPRQIFRPSKSEKRTQTKDAALKLVWASLFKKSSKTSSAITMLSISFLLLMTCMMVLTGYQENVSNTVSLVIHPQQYIAIKQNYTGFSQTEIDKIENHPNVIESYSKMERAVVASFGEQRLSVTFQNIPSDESLFSYHRFLKGGYPSETGQVAINARLATLLFGLDENALRNYDFESTPLHLSIELSDQAIRTFIVSGIVDVTFQNDENHIYVSWETAEEWFEEESFPQEGEHGEMIVFAALTARQTKLWSEELAKEGILLERASKTVIEDIESRFGFITSVFSVATVVTIALCATAIIIQVNRIIERDKKKNVVLFSLGANAKDIRRMIALELVLVVTSSIVIATLVSSMLSVLLDLVLGTHVSQVISFHTGVLVPSRRMLADGWFFYPIFFVLANAFTYTTTMLVLSKNESITKIQNLKRE